MSEELKLRTALDVALKALDFYADPWPHMAVECFNPDESVPDFYSELSFGDRAAFAIEEAQAILADARPASGEREGEIQKESANEDSETVVRMALQGSQQRIVSARPKLVADHVAAVPQDVPLRADRGEAVTPAPSLPSQAENVVPMHKVPPMYKIIDGKRIDLISEDDPAFVLADESKGDE